MARTQAHLQVIAPPPAPPARASAARRSRAAAGDDAAAATSTRRIVDAITAAIVERRLLPGTKLAEQRIGTIFQVSRTVVRQALHQLSRDRLVTLEPARGAFVARPSAEEARQVFAARGLIEAAMIKALCRQVTPAQLEQLRAHLRQEREAIVRADVAGRTRLLADFHVQLARLLGNEVLAQLLADLLARCALITLMDQSANSAEHSHEEHEAIVDALERRDARAAVRLIESHLANVERNLRLDPRTSDLAKALNPDD